MRFTPRRCEECGADLSKDNHEKNCRHYEPAFDENEGDGNCGGNLKKAPFDD